MKGHDVFKGYATQTNFNPGTGTFEARSQQHEFVAEPVINSEVIELFSQIRGAGRMKTLRRFGGQMRAGGEDALPLLAKRVGR